MINLNCLVCGQQHNGLACATNVWPFPPTAPTMQLDGEPPYHPDDLAIDAFAAVMKAKMALTRAKGRQGWDDPHQCTVEDLSIGLRVCVGKGDPVDVALFAMMLAARGARIVGVRPPMGTPAATLALHEELDRQIACDKVREKEQAKRDRRAEAREGSGRRSVDKAKS